MPCIQIGINTMILQNTEEAFIGRVNGILNPLFMGAMVLTMSIAGWLKSIMTITLFMKFAALLLIIRFYAGSINEIGKNESEHTREEA